MDPLYRFEQEGNACRILTPAPPRHWYNYLWNEDRYCAQVSQMGHGRSYYLDAEAHMCQINRDEARYVFLRDDEMGDAWNIGQGPLNTPVEDYACSHAIGCSTISSRYKGVAASWRLFVPQRGFHEVWTLKIKNAGDISRRISVFSAVTFHLDGFSYPRYYEMYRTMTTRFDPDLNGVFCASAHPFAPHGRYNGFLSSTEQVAAFDGELSAFCGSGSTLTLPDASACALFQRPSVVAEGKDCTNSEGALFILGGVLQHKLMLHPGEEKEIQVLYGIAETVEEARATTAAYHEAGRAERELAAAEKAYFAKYQSLSVATPDEKVNAIMNSWVKKQVDFCIVGKKGVRDNLQIAAALLSYRPDKAKDEILECLRHQFRDGHAVLTWHPYDDTRYSDQPFWIIWAVCRLIRETGDFFVLNERIQWQDGGEATVLEHVKAAVNRLIADKGRNGLVRIYFADWNDALNITTDDGAESVMLSHQFCMALRDLAAVVDRAGDAGYAARLRREFDILKTAINDHAWDGKWYARALTEDGPIGAQSSKGSHIYLNAQTWAVLGDVAPPERLAAVLAAVDGMEHDFGFPLNLPPYPVYDPQVGRMSGMLPGLFENGGIYCHATGFKVLMDCKAGRGNKAYETLKKIMPDSEENPSMQSGAEPYVFTNCYSPHPAYYGKSYQSWTTGTSAWCLMGLYEGILGIIADFNGLRVRPCLPSTWERIEMTRSFRGADYHITILNPHHKETGTSHITVDGTAVDGDILPDFRDGQLHKVQVEL
ncbi:MAG: cellobiose phosphorylase [Christensenellaceae bacterium]|jgi:cellobiose phosphorylase|nr:cellobiose phosphorylase [Christensenellaceae bacterium]